MEMRYPPLNYTKVCWLCLCFALVDMIYLQEEEDQILLEKWQTIVHYTLPIYHMRSMVMGAPLT